MRKPRWSSIKQHLFLRQIPYGVFSWRYFLPKQSKAVHLHRAIFIKTCINKPYPLRLLLVIYRLILWYLFFSWRQSIRAWAKHRESVRITEGVSSQRQFIQLVLLSLLHSTPPVCYYQHKLYRYPEKNWLDFIFTHELPEWHNYFSPNISEYSRKVLTDKDFFQQEFSKIRLPVIPTSHLLQNGKSFDIFQKQNLYLKPIAGSQSRGCFTLNYSNDKDTYTLTGANFSVNTRKDITDKITTALIDDHYLVQPLLTNHPWLSMHLKLHSLATIRLATMLRNGQPVCISACLNLPAYAESIRTDTFPININTRKLVIEEIQDSDIAINTDTETYQSLASEELPLWSEIQSTAVTAHKQLPDVFSVGWDIALTTQGVTLIEGNINWGVYEHQLLSPSLIQDFLYLKFNNTVNQKK